MRRRLLDRRLATAVVGGVVVSLVVWWPVLASGAVPAAADMLFRYTGLYRATSALDFDTWVNTWAEGVALLWPLWLPTLVACFVPVSRRRLVGTALARSVVARAALVWSVVELAFLMSGERLFDHYLLLLVPPLSLLFGLVLCDIWPEHPQIGRRALGWALCASVAVGLAWQSPPTSPTDSLIAVNTELADYVRANSAPSESIYVWGWDPDLYVRSNRAPAGPYFYMLPMTTPGYFPQAVATEAESWQAHPPRLVVTGSWTDLDPVGLYPLDEWSTTMASNSAMYYEGVAPLRTFIRSHYDLVEIFGDGEVWRYRG